MWTDTHVHLGFFGSSNHLTEVIEKAQDAEVNLMINIGDTLESSRQVVRIALKHEPVYGAVGVHPNEGGSIKPAVFRELKKLANYPKIAAIGEIGLDYYRNHTPHSDQQNLFREQLLLAAELDMPVIVHERDAFDDVMSIIEESGFPWDKVLFHCFSGNCDKCETVLQKGITISVGGSLTYPANNDLREAIKKAPIEKILLETDSPFLPPQPHRGDTNHPEYLPLIGEAFADLLDITTLKAAKQTTRNAIDFFDLPLEPH